MLLKEESCKFVMINTSKGFYQYTRSHFGIASAPAVFQKTMETILQGIEGVISYIDGCFGCDKDPRLTSETVRSVLHSMG